MNPRGGGGRAGMGGSRWELRAAGAVGGSYGAGGHGGGEHLGGPEVRDGAVVLK